MFRPDDLLTRLVERAESRYFGKYRGHVQDNNDPSSLGRIKASVPQVLGDLDTGWAVPAFPMTGKDQGFFMVPEVGTGVWIEFEAGDPSYPIWSGGWYADGEVPAEAKQPDVKVIKTKSGHVIVLDDAGSKLQLTDSNGNTLTMDQSGVSIQDLTGNSIKMETTGITIASATGSKIELTATGVSINDGALTVLP